MKKSKILSKIAIAALIIGIVSTNTMVTVKATDMNQVVEEFDLKIINEVPEDAKVLKFDTYDQAKRFLSVLKDNQGEGILDLESIASVNEINSGTIDLSNKHISEENFKKYNEFEDFNTSKTDIFNNSQLRGIQPRRYETTLNSSRILGPCKLKYYCNVTVDWSSSKGNYVSKVNNISSGLSGFYMGSAWTQLGYSSNISRDGKTVSANVTGHFDYYILINTSLTQFAGETVTYYTEFYY